MCARERVYERERERVRERPQGSQSEEQKKICAASHGNEYLPPPRAV